MTSNTSKREPRSEAWAALFGKQVTFGWLHTTKREQMRADGFHVPAGEQLVVVEVGDLGDVPVVILNAMTGEPVWVNPSDPEEAIERYVRAARLVTEALDLFEQTNA